jgi:hypothetical protein
MDLGGMLRGVEAGEKGWSYLLDLLVLYLGLVKTVVVGEYRQMVAGGAAYHLQRGSVLYVGHGRLMVVTKRE